MRIICELYSDMLPASFARIVNKCCMLFVNQGIDVKSMGRIFIGLIKCGAWGCFDEFNRLEEAVLSAVSMQIQVIQDAIKQRSPSVELLARKVSSTSTADAEVFSTRIYDLGSKCVERVCVVLFGMHVIWEVCHATVNTVHELFADSFEVIAFTGC